MRPAIPVLWFTLGCNGAAAFDDDAERALVTGPRIVGVRATPAESRPGTTVRLEPVGIGDGPVALQRCDTPAPRGSLAAVPPECLQPNAAAVTAPELTAFELQIPADACRRFGSDGGQDARAIAPDRTGGHAQPFVWFFGGTATVSLHRIRCSDARLPITTAQALGAAYTPNLAPAVTVESTRSGRETQLTARAAADAAESYALVPNGTTTLVQRTEQLSFQWFATAPLHGSLSGALDPLGAPPTVVVEGPATVWFVLADERGATAVEVAATE